MNQVKEGTARVQGLAVGACVVLLGACGSQHVDEPVRQTDQPIAGVSTQTDSTSVSGPVSTVALISSPSNATCSGTFITRNKVLTAAHCVCNKPLHAVDPPSTVSVSLPGAQGPTPFSTIATKIVLHPKALVACSVGLTTRPHDMAVIELATSPSTAHLADPAQVFIGPLKSEYEKGNFPFGNTIAGYGEPTPGTRRFGIWGSYDIIFDPCDKPFELDCYSDYVWKGTTDTTIAAVSQPGDSGGPFFLTHANGTTLLVGVHSGSQDTVSLPFTAFSLNSFSIKATMNPKSNALFVLGALGPDADSDQVTDDADNCPPSLCVERGWDISRCSNENQTDNDNDGVGDVCDNCPPIRCQTLAGLQSCWNPSQADKDGDGAGNTCDLCPDYPIDTLIDSDDDGWGDECDTCAVANPSPTCFSDSNCPGGTCLAEPAGIANVGRCSTPADADGDDIADACDSCPDIPNALRNSNLYAENRDLQSELDDNCDPVPIVRAEIQKPNQISFSELLQLTGGDNSGPDDLQPLQADRWLGRETATSPQSTHLRSVAFRHCDCFLGGVKLPLDQCVGGAFVPCQWNNPVANPNLWKTITIRQGTQIIHPNPLGQAFTTPLSFQVGVSAPFDTLWEWRTDVAAGKITAIGTCSANPFSCETHGAVLTRVLGPTTGSARDTASPGLREAFQLFSTPALAPYIEPPGRILPQCDGAPCLRWVDPKLYLEDPALLDFTNLFDTPVALTVAPDGQVQALVDGTVSYDVGSRISQEVGALLSDSNNLWLHPVESASRIRASSLRTVQQAAVVGRDFVPDVGVQLVEAGPSGLQVVNRVPGPEVSAVAGLVSTSPAPRSDVRAAFSQLENAIYMVGGVRGGRPTQAIWRYSTRTRTWTMLAEDAGVAPSARVLSVTYDQAAGHLYVLDIDDDPLAEVLVADVDHGSPSWKKKKKEENEKKPETSAKKIQRARLLRFALRAVGGPSAEVVATWPAQGAFDTIHIAVLADGQLALVTGKKTKYRVWRLVVFPNGKLKFAGAMSGNGRLLGQPVMSGDQLTVAIEDTHGIRYVPVAHFKPGPECKGL